MPGLRAGLLAGDPTLVSAVIQGRRDLGLIPSGPAQHTAATLLADDEHVRVQLDRHRRRLDGLVAVLSDLGLDVRPPEGGMFAWVRAPGGSGRRWAARLAADHGIVVTPGAVYGPAGTAHARLAAVVDPSLLHDRLTPAVKENLHS